MKTRRWKETEAGVSTHAKTRQRERERTWGPDTKIPLTEALLCDIGARETSSLGKRVDDEEIVVLELLEALCRSETTAEDAR